MNDAGLYTPSSLYATPKNLDLYEILKVRDVYLMHDCVSIPKTSCGSNVGKNVEELLILGSGCFRTSWLGVW